jgi:hypothetical protein
VLTSLIVLAFIGCFSPQSGWAQQDLNVSASGFADFTVTLPANPSPGQTKHIRISGPLGTVTIRATRLSDGSNGTFDLTTPVTVFSGGGSSVATLIATEDSPNLIWYLRIVSSVAVPAGGENWQIRVENGGGSAIELRWLAADTGAATQVADVDMDTTPLDFGDIMVGDTRALTVTIHNRFVASLTLSAAFQHGNRRFETVGTVPSAVPPMSSANVDIQFSPLEESPAPPYADTLILTTNDPDPAEQTINIPLQGNGVLRRLVLCLDASGSMRTRPNATTYEADAGPLSRMAQVKNALEPFLDMLEAEVTAITSEGRDPGLKIGVVKFQSSTAQVVSSLSDVNPASLFVIKSNVGIPYSPGTGIQPAGGTPMNAGLQSSLGLFGSAPVQPRPEGVILLMSDGANTEATSPTDPGGAVDAIQPRQIGVFSLAFGDQTTGVFDVDHALLSQIASRTDGEFLTYAPGGVVNPDLPNFFTKALDISTGTQTSFDPLAHISAGQTKEHVIPISASDRRASFIVSWGENHDDLLSLTLVTPDGTVITKTGAQMNPYIQYKQGARSILYLVDHRYFRQPGKIGSWKMRVSFNRSTSRRVGLPSLNYSYTTLVASDLNLDVTFDKSNYLTGDSVRIEASLTDRGKPILGADVRLNSAKPNMSLGNWYVAHPITKADYAKIPDGLYKMDKFSQVFLKGYVLTKLKKLPAPKIVPHSRGIPLYDDGSHGDSVKDDGIYTHLSEPLDKTGVHTYHIVANGEDLMGGHFRREKRTDQYVDLRPDPKLSEFSFEKIATLERGVTRYRVKMIPKDRYGNYMPPGSQNKINLVTSAGKWAAPTIDTLQGEYYRDLDVSKQDKPKVVLDTQGVRFPALEMKMSPIKRLFRPLFGSRW